MFNLILFGPPGSGKGTQSEKLIEKYSLVHLSTGNLLRAERDNKTKLGLEAESLMKRGLLVPDEIVIGMIRTAIEANPNARGFLFDGFPRTVAQAEALDRLLAEKSSSISIVLALEVSQEELVQRLLNRGRTSGRSDDTDPEVIRARIIEYENKTAQVADHYRQFDKVEQIKGEGGIDDIFMALCDRINSRQPA
jgi:adenylate kinase